MTGNSKTMHRLSQGTPKDMIPAVKSPRRQRSSRFFGQEQVELEPYPHFSGMFVCMCVCVYVCSIFHLPLFCSTSIRGATDATTWIILSQVEPVSNHVRFQWSRQRPQRKGNQATSVTRLIGICGYNTTGHHWYNLPWCDSDGKYAHIQTK